VVGEGRNLREVTGDPTAHAEVVALREAAASRDTWNLEGCTLVVTLEPCVMCAGALLQARVSRLVFGAWDDKAGAAGSVYDVVRDRRLPYRAEVVGGVAEEAATRLLQEFFTDRR
jgi:tRNA(adenine34) deaminase